MPRFNGMGPLGQGPGTGRGFGPCGAGYRRGFGFRRFFDRAEERDVLKEEAGYLEQELKDIKARLAQLKAQK